MTKEWPPPTPKEQVASFLSFIELPKDLQDASPSLALLRELHICTICAFPYENLSLHYNPSHSIDLDPQSLFTKVITNNRGRGGYCMEIALMYNHIPWALGFDVYTASVRTRPRIHGVPQGDYPGWGHIVNIVTLPNGSKYHSDVAFGGDGPTAPLPLTDGHVHYNLGAQEVRLIRDWIPTQTHRTEASKLWTYQFRNDHDLDWLSFYAFPEIEFLQADWNVLNLWMNTHEESQHVKDVLCVKFTRTGNGCGGKGGINVEIYVVNDLVKKTLVGKTKIVKVLESEAERLEALREWFGITFTEEERRWIDGSPLRLA